MEHFPLLVASVDRGVISHSKIERETRGGGHSHISDEDARRKIQINPQGRQGRVRLKLKLAPKGDFCVVRVRAFFCKFL